MTLNKLINNLNVFFQIMIEQDPAMKTFVPMVYDAIGFDRKTFFEHDFCQRFNGLMIK
jgi:hypothetical protein